MLLSYLATRDIRRERWRHHILQAGKEAAFALIDEAATESYEDTGDVASYASAMPCRHDDKVDTSAGNKEE
jgi:hypothetical protein